MTPGAQHPSGSRSAGDSTASPAARVGAELRRLYPGTFALVMATGIISNAAFALGHLALSEFLLAVNLVAFPLLALALAVRALRFPRELWADLTSPRLVFTFFTLVAASDVLGLQLVERGHLDAAVALWVAALVAWMLLSYLSFSVLTFLNSGSGADVVHGGWLIAIVGTESLVLLGAHVAPHFGPLAPLAFLALYAFWGIGVVLYGIFITLFSYRLFFLPVETDDVTPLFWVVMGAAAIATNAGSTLILTDPGLGFLLALRPFLDGATLVLWAWATWWIPLLVILGIWKHVVRRVPVAYHPMYWSFVFPLGMYTLATWRLSLAADFPPMQWLPRVMLWVAIAAWAATMAGALGAFWRVLRGSTQQAA